MRGSVAPYLGLLATRIRAESAESHFKAALELNERMGARPWRPRAQRDFARMLLDRGETQRASDIAAAALATYRDLGMEGYAARTSSLVLGVSPEDRRRDETMRTGGSSLRLRNS
jgi:hypothetical protein